MPRLPNGGRTSWNEVCTDGNIKYLYFNSSGYKEKCHRWSLGVTYKDIHLLELQNLHGSCWIALPRLIRIIHWRHPIDLWDKHCSAWFCVHMNELCFCEFLWLRAWVSALPRLSSGGETKCWNECTEGSINSLHFNSSRYKRPRLLCTPEMAYKDINRLSLSITYIDIKAWGWGRTCMDTELWYRGWQRYVIFYKVLCNLICLDRLPIGRRTGCRWNQFTDGT